MKCSKCGAEINDRAFFCKYCGNKIRDIIVSPSEKKASHQENDKKSFRFYQNARDDRTEAYTNVAGLDGSDMTEPDSADVEVSVTKTDRKEEILPADRKEKSEFQESTVKKESIDKDKKPVRKRTRTTERILAELGLGSKTLEELEMEDEKEPEITQFIIDDEPEKAQKVQKTEPIQEQVKSEKQDVADKGSERTLNADDGAKTQGRNVKAAEKEKVSAETVDENAKGAVKKEEDFDFLTEQPNARANVRHRRRRKKQKKAYVARSVSVMSVSLSIIVTLLLYVTISALILVASMRQSVLADNFEKSINKLKIEELEVNNIVKLDLLKQIVTKNISPIIFLSAGTLIFVLVVILIRINVMGRKYVFFYTSLACILSGSNMLEASTHYERFAQNLSDALKLSRQYEAVLLKGMSDVMESVSNTILGTGIIIELIFLALIIAQIIKTPDHRLYRSHLERVMKGNQEVTE